MATAVITWYFANRPSCQPDPACLRLTFGVGLAVVVGTAVTLIFLLSMFMTRWISNLTLTTRRVLTGDRRARMMHYGRGEAGDFIHLYNQLLDLDNQQIDELTEERDQLASVLAYMADGVINADAYGYVRQVNQFLGGSLDEQKMAAMVDPSLYRNRA